MLKVFSIKNQKKNNDQTSNSTNSNLSNSQRSSAAQLRITKGLF